MTELETRILKVVVSAGGHRLSIEELANEVGCTADTVYKRLSDKPEFQELFKEALVNSLTAELPGIFGSFVDEAKAGSFKHGKLLMELTGVYKEDKNSTINVNMREAEEPFKSDEDRRSFLKATLSGLLQEESDSDD